MRWINSRVTWGVLLIAGGVIFLLQNLGLLPESALLWSIAFAIPGLFFLGIFLTDRERWWAVFPAMPLLGISGLLLMEALRPDLTDDWGGVLVLGAVGLSFLFVYLRDRGRWWGLIPFGVLATLSLLVYLEEIARDSGFLGSAGVLFIGLGITFLLVWLAPTPNGRQRWAIWPAIGTLAFGFLTGSFAFDYFNLVWPAALILLGLSILFRRK